MSKTQSKNDAAWEQLFLRYHISEQIEKFGMFEISAAQINVFREARLMTKFDHRVNLPPVFKKERLSILPITRGSYVIARFDAYHDLEEREGKIQEISFPGHITSIDYQNISGESTAIHCAFVSGIFSDFLEDEEIYPTVSGRMGSSQFRFHISRLGNDSNIQMEVHNSQIEIDGGFEGHRHLTLVEAKNFVSEDFLIRQLYYPYRLWGMRLGKTIRPVFMVYSNAIFTLYEYAFSDPTHYNSLYLMKTKKYSLEKVKITKEDIWRVWKSQKRFLEPEVSFPQADSFNRVINLCELLDENEKTKEEITIGYAFDQRQTSYYTDAGRYLGLILKYRRQGEVVFRLTEEGQRILKLPYKERQLKFVEKILGHDVFAKGFQFYEETGKIPNRDLAVAFMKASHLPQVVAQSTFYRRASTIIGWIRWILSLPRES
jgi:hypothetical protein